LEECAEYREREVRAWVSDIPLADRWEAEAPRLSHSADGDNESTSTVEESSPNLLHSRVHVPTHVVTNVKEWYTSGVSASHLAGAIVKFLKEVARVDDDWRTDNHRILASQLREQTDHVLPHLVQLVYLTGGLENVVCEVESLFMELFLQAIAVVHGYESKADYRFLVTSMDTRIPPHIRTLMKKSMKDSARLKRAKNCEEEEIHPAAKKRRRRRRKGSQAQAERGGKAQGAAHVRSAQDFPQRTPVVVNSAPGRQGSDDQGVDHHATSDEEEENAPVNQNLRGVGAELEDPRVCTRTPDDLALDDTEFEQPVEADDEEDTPLSQNHGATDDVDAELGDLLHEGMSESSCEEDDFEGDPEGPSRTPSPEVDSAQDGNGRRGGFVSPTATLTAGLRAGASQTHVIGGQAIDPYGMMRDELRALERMAADYDATNRVECTDYGEYLLPEIDGTLDHVDVAGCIDLESIRAAVRNPGCPLHVALWALMDDSFEESLVPRGKLRKRTFKEYLKFVEEMVDADLCDRASRKDKAKAYSGFFTVLKKEVDGIRILRTILNCEGLNLASPKAPPVNLPSLLEVQEAFKDCKFLKALDFRHYFHQMSINKKLQDWLHIAIGPARIKWKVLPMGWTWAPFIAEAVSWYFAVGDQVNEWSELPRVYRSEDGVVVVIWYDNVFAGAESEEALEKFWSAMMERCTKHKVVVKEVHAAHEGQSIECIGLRWHVTDSGVRWELLEKTKTKLRQIPARLEETALPIKEVAKFVGCIVWGLWSQRQGLYCLRNAYEALSNAVKDFGWKGIMSTASIKDLGDVAMRLATSDEIHGFDQNKPKVYLASDASLTGYGVVDLVTGWQVRGQWKCWHETGDMYYLEALAAKRAVLSAPEGTDIMLFTDNMGLVCSLRKRSSRCPRTARVLEELDDALKQRRQTLRVFHIASEENPADGPSRGDVADVEVTQNLRHRMDAMVHG
jgi:hypothetical protein